jgi:hypothetical protein
MKSLSDSSLPTHPFAFFVLEHMQGIKLQQED